MLVAHDYYEAPEGGGRLALILARELGADLAYGFRAKGHPFFEEPFPGAEVDLGVRAKAPGLKQYALARAFMKRTEFTQRHEVAIFSGFYSPLAVMAWGAKKNICYCHTPPRFVYDQRDFYLRRMKPWERPVLTKFIRWFQPKYELAMKKMDLVIANSKNVQGRIQKYLALTAPVVYPPCEVENFRHLEQEGYFLSVARLDPLKRVDVIVEAFSQMPEKRLKVISCGPDFKKIQKLAKGHDNIEILGPVSEKRYRDLLERCIASIYIPKNEDFGMTAVESLAAGKPVIASAGGGLEEIINNRVGVLQKEPSVATLVKTIGKFDPQRGKELRDTCIERAKDFSVEVFSRGIKRLLNSV